MCKKVIRNVILAAALVFSLQSLAQVKTNGVALGLAGGMSMGDTDFGRDDQFGLSIDAFVRHSIVGPLEGQLSGHFLGQIKREDNNAYQTNLNSGDYRLLLRLFSAKALSPYVYGGGGALYYEVKEAPANLNRDVSSSDWALYAPVGGGIQIRATDFISLDLSGGYSFVFSDALNQFEVNDDDGYFHGMAGLTFTGESGSADPDFDGLSNDQEKKIGTNKNIADTDGDGLKDGDEFTTHATNPLEADSDGDGLDDREEVLTYQTSPNKTDTDGDGLGDREEVEIHKTDPNKTDTDGDKLSDQEEVATHKTNPLEADSDGDGLTDGEELLSHKTLAAKADSDDDGLSDGDEVKKHQTNPMVADSDGGSVNDGVEVNRGTNPLKAEDDVILEIEEGAPIILDGVVFASGKADISEESARILDKAYQTMLAYPDMLVEIHGYTDSTGKRSSNLRLSQRRADSVRNHLVSLGIDGSRIRARGFGPDNPIATNETAEGRRQNRRIEFVRVK